MHCSPTGRPALTKKWWTACSIRRTMASAWLCSGSTWHVTPTRTATISTAIARCGTGPTNPLTARVAVNRHWQMYFGHGIVKTPEDFGSQGEAPVHPELLDWLATEFIRTGWDIRAMQRLIVTSAAYRQDSRVTPEVLEKDPENRLLARGFQDP